MTIALQARLPKGIQNWSFVDIATTSQPELGVFNSSSLIIIWNCEMAIAHRQGFQKASKIDHLLTSRTRSSKSLVWSIRRFWSFLTLQNDSLRWSKGSQDHPKTFCFDLFLMIEIQTPNSTSYNWRFTQMYNFSIWNFFEFVSSANVFVRDSYLKLFLDSKTWRTFRIVKSTFIVNSQFYCWQILFWNSICVLYLPLHHFKRD